MGRPSNDGRLVYSSAPCPFTHRGSNHPTTEPGPNDIQSSAVDHQRRTSLILPTSYSGGRVSVPWRNGNIYAIPNIPNQIVPYPAEVVIDRTTRRCTLLEFYANVALCRMVRALQTHLYPLHSMTAKTKTELSLSLAPSVPFSVSDETPSPASCLDRKVTYSLPNTAIFIDCLPSSLLQQSANPSAIHSCHFRKAHSTRAFSPTPTPTAWPYHVSSQGTNRARFIAICSPSRVRKAHSIPGLHIRKGQIDRWDSVGRHFW